MKPAAAYRFVQRSEARSAIIWALLAATNLSFFVATGQLINALASIIATVVMLRRTRISIAARAVAYMAERMDHVDLLRAATKKPSLWEAA